MKVMVMIEGSGADEDKIAPTEEMLREMGAYNEQLVQAGIMLDGQGLHPTSKGARVVFEGGSTTSVVDGPFTESKEIIAGLLDLGGQLLGGGGRVGEALPDRPAVRRPPGAGGAPDLQRGGLRRRVHRRAAGPGRPAREEIKVRTSPSTA